MGSAKSRPKERSSDYLVSETEFRSRTKAAQNEELRELYADRSFFVAILSTLAVIFGGAGIIHLLGIYTFPFFINVLPERDADGQWDYLSAMYFCSVTITTIGNISFDFLPTLSGYGDLTPQTVGGKLFVIFYTIIGVGLLAYSLSIISQKMVDTVDYILEITRSFRRNRRGTSMKNATGSGSLELDELLMKTTPWTELPPKTDPKRN